MATGKVVIFGTEAEAETRQAADLVDHLDSHNDSSDYTAQTTRWGTPKLRLDTKWDYETCPHSDYTGLTVQDYNQNDYAEISDEEE